MFFWSVPTKFQQHPHTSRRRCLHDPWCQQTRNQESSWGSLFRRHSRSLWRLGMQTCLHCWLYGPKRTPREWQGISSHAYPWRSGSQDHGTPSPYRSAIVLSRESYRRWSSYCPSWHRWCPCGTGQSLHEGPWRGCLLRQASQPWSGSGFSDSRVATRSTCPTSRWHCTRYTSCHIPFVHPREISRQGLIAVDVVVLITENGPVHEASWTLAVGSGIIDFKLWFPSNSSASSNGTSTGLVDDVAPEPFEFGARPPDPSELLACALSWRPPSPIKP